MHAVVGIGESGELGKMSNADHLAVPGQSPQLFTDYLPTPPANADINFIENKDGDIIGLGQCPF